MKVPFVLALPVLLLVGRCLLPQAQAASPEVNTAMQEGIHDFGAGAFQEALDKFLQARRQGLSSPALRYDLGATYYKLGRDAEAAAEFKSLLSDPKFSDFARYNLGLTSLRTGHKREAYRYFTQVAEQAHDTHLQALARTELHDYQPRGPHGWQVFVEMVGGYDDNVLLAPNETLLTIPSAGSAMYSVIASGGGWLIGGHDRGWRLAGSLYDVQYPDQRAFNLLIAQAGPEYLLGAGSWALRAGASGARINLGPDELEAYGALNLRGEHPFAGGTLRLNYRLERITGGVNYAYLSGVQNQFGVRTSWQPGRAEILLGYSLALNHRQDLRTATQFFSVSPLRNQLETQLSWTATPRSSFYVHGLYWWNLYRDPNVFLQSGVRQQQKRSDTGYVTELGWVYRVTSKVSVTSEYARRNSDSNIQRYGYTSNQVSLSLQFTF
jgi:tetratricopeptide (TPR) repeat protein